MCLVELGCDQTNGMTFLPLCRGEGMCLAELAMMKPHPDRAALLQLPESALRGCVFLHSGGAKLPEAAKGILVSEAPVKVEDVSKGKERKKDKEKDKEKKEKKVRCSCGLRPGGEDTPPQTRLYLIGIKVKTFSGLSP